MAAWDAVAVADVVAVWLSVPEGGECWVGLRTPQQVAKRKIYEDDDFLYG